MLADSSKLDYAVTTLPTRVETDGSKPLVYLSFFLLIGVSVAMGWRIFLATLTLAWSDDRYTHILLIGPIAASLICLNWRGYGKPVRRDFTLGLMALVVAMAVTALLVWHPEYLTRDVQLSIGMLALAISWIGAFFLCFGTRVAREQLFPLCLLFGLVTIPQAVVDVIIRMLQVGSAQAAYLLFATAGVPVSRDGVMLTVPSLTIEVAKECSSIRSSLMLVVATMVLAHLLLKSSWRKGLVVALAVPLSVAKNGLRIFTIVILGTRVDPGYLTGRLHHQGGVIFLAISLVAVGSVIWILRRTEPASPYAGRHDAEFEARPLLEN
jgi:exosortase